ncbi:hypothetical protein BDN72DRAFT_894770 [Pluteus cervinus]|uniref:Uncharacterized protein n=1 Tax=Pluteus cervinus TaxID=181527 RepID=A0ACD3B361_9AGAR|nr:hypothetical protein BDN72DRAFT_894770 [Pluteus cervinus]
MALAPTADESTWKGVIISTQVAGISAGVFRVIYRTQQRCFFLEDIFSSLALAGIIFYLTSSWMLLQNSGAIHDVDRAVVLFWMSSITFPWVVWTSRISLSISVLRFVMKHSFLRSTLLFFIWVMAAMGLSVICERLWTCGARNNWEPILIARCQPGSGAAILSLATNTLSNLYLVISPLYLYFTETRLSDQRHFFWAIFAAGVINQCAPIAYAVLILEANSLKGPSDGLAISMVANIEASVSLLTCNLLVIMTCFQPRARREEPAVMSQLTFAPHFEQDGGDDSDIGLFTLRESPVSTRNLRGGSLAAVPRDAASGASVVDPMATFDERDSRDSLSTIRPNVTFV